MGDLESAISHSALLSSAVRERMTEPAGPEPTRKRQGDGDALGANSRTALVG
jgi:hypothetical protein